MSLSIKEQFTALRKEGRFTPDPLWIEKNKHTLMSRIEMEEVSVPVKKAWQIFIPARMLFAARPVATLVVVSIVSVVGWTASVSASYQSLPGDFLYSVKIASERTQIAFAGIVQGSEKKAKLLNDAAKTRAYEAKALIAQNKDIKLVEETLLDLEETVEEAAQITKDVTEEIPESASQIVSELAESNELITDTLGEVFDGTDFIESDIVEKVVKTSQAVTGQSLEAVQNIIEQQERDGLAGDTSEEVKEVVGDIIEAVNKNIIETAEALVKITVTKQEETVVSTTDTGTATSSTDVVTSTDMREDEEDTVDVVAQEEVTMIEEDAEDAIQEVAGNIEEALQLFDEGRLSEALDKVFSATQVGNSVEEDATIIVEAIEENLPEEEVDSSSTSTPDTVSSTSPQE